MKNDKSHRRAGGGRLTGFLNSAAKIALIASVAGAALPGAAAAQSAAEKPADWHSMKFMVFNIWNQRQNNKFWDPVEKAKGNLVFNEQMRQLLLDTAPDVVAFPEIYNNDVTWSGKNIRDEFARNVIDVLGPTSDGKAYPNRIPYRQEANRDMLFSSVAFENLPGRSNIRINPGSGFPAAYVGGIHLNYYDEPTTRLVQAKDYNRAAAAVSLPTILAGDFNAGDVSERGLHRAEQQKLILKGAAGGSAFYQKLIREYAQMAAAAGKGGTPQFVEDYIAARNGSAPIPDGLFVDETYPVLSNTPVTTNVLKKQFQLMDTEASRENFEPLKPRDGKTTWTSSGEDSTNVWASWDRVAIDRVIVSRPFAKWIEIDTSDPHSGVLHNEATSASGQSLSDHEPMAWKLRWTGPQLEIYKGADDKEKTRFVWGSGAYGFEGRNKEFFLTRNNMRNDVYLGQISDQDGAPLAGLSLSLEEKKSRLDCASSDPRFQQAIKDYCIDDHSFIGETLVTDGGTLIVEEDAALGGAAATLRLANGGLRIAGQSMGQLDRPVVVDQQGRLDVAGAANTVSVVQGISGAGRLVKLGAGTLELAAVNSYQGGTQVEAGTLRSTIAGGFVSGGAYVVNGGTLDLNGFNLTASVLAGQGGQIAVGNATLVVDQAVDTAFAGSVSGSGALIKQGTGSLMLTGDNSAFTGSISVSNGALRANGSLGASLSIASGATLGGTATVGATTIDAGAVHAPGNSIGTQTVAGNYANRGTLQIEATPDDADRVVVTGDVDIAGASLELLLSPQTAASWKLINGPYTFIDNQGTNAVSARFSTVEKNLIFLDPLLNYAGGDGNDVTLQLVRNDVTFASVGQTRNQLSVGGAVEGMSSADPVWNAMATSATVESARMILDQLSGEMHASIQGSLNDDSRFWRNTVNDRLAAAFGSATTDAQPVMAYGEDGRAAASTADTDRFAMWTSGFGSWADRSGGDNAAAFSSSIGGVFVGGDAFVAENWRVGLSGGYSRSSFDVGDRASSGAADSYHVGIYGGTRIGGLGLRAGAAYAWHDIDAQRYVLGERLNAGYGAGTAQVYGEAGYEFKTARAAFEPFANLAYASTSTDAFGETGGVAALSSESGTTSTTFTTLGVRASTAFDLGSMQATARGSLGWRHAFGDITPEASLAFAGSNAFGIAGNPIAKDAFLVGAGFDLNLAPSATLGISYDGQFGSGQAENGFNAKLNVRF